MILSEEVKQTIITEYEEFKESMYAGKTKEERDELAQFFTPPEITFTLLNEYKIDSLSGLVIRDPTCGSGNLLAACLIAGADSDKIYGNDYDATMVKLCRDRLNKVCRMLNKPELNDWQIHQGNALQARCLIDFSEEYSGKRSPDGQILSRYNPEYIDDLDYAQSYDHEEVETYELFGETFTNVKTFKAKSWRTENEEAKARALKNKPKQIVKQDKAEQLAFDLGSM